MFKIGHTMKGNHPQSDVPPSPCSVRGSLVDIKADLMVMSAGAPAVPGDRLMLLTVTHVLQSSNFLSAVKPLLWRTGLPPVAHVKNVTCRAMTGD